AQMAENEGRHWWFVGRRAVIGARLDRIALPDRPRILEAGCGTGGNQERMPAARINRVLGAAFALERHLVARGSIPFGLSYGLILQRPRETAGTGTRHG
ncbi:MAG: hypothetical protein ABIZ72_10695, partial [Candidatus Limnocylindrales bacterium]